MIHQPNISLQYIVFSIDLINRGSHLVSHFRSRIVSHFRPRIVSHNVFSLIDMIRSMHCLDSTSECKGNTDAARSKSDSFLRRVNGDFGGDFDTVDDNDGSATDGKEDGGKD
jgi:hypothetical protein